MGVRSGEICRFRREARRSAGVGLPMPAVILAAGSSCAWGGATLQLWSRPSAPREVDHIGQRLGAAREADPRRPGRSRSDDVAALQQGQYFGHGRHRLSHRRQPLLCEQRPRLSRRLHRRAGLSCAERTDDCTVREGRFLRCGRQARLARSQAAAELGRILPPLSRPTIIDIDPHGGQVLLNLPRSRIFGAEVEPLAKPSRSLSVSASLAISVSIKGNSCLCFRETDGSGNEQSAKPCGSSFKLFRVIFS